MAHGGDTVLLAILIQVIRQNIRSKSHISDVLKSLSQHDFCNVLPRVQRDFCTLWNEVAIEARIKGERSTACNVLHWGSPFLSRPT